MSKSIKISGDTSELRKSILELSRMVTKDLAKSKIELFTPETKKFLRGEALSTMDSIKKQIDSIKDSTKRHQQALAEVVKGSKEELRLKEKIVKASQHIAKLEHDRGRTANVASQLSKPGFAKQLGKYSGISGAMGGIGAMGMLGGAGALLGLGGVAAAGYGISRVMSGRETYTGGVADRIRLRGRGVADLDPTDAKATEGAGLNSLSLRQARMRDIDVFGRQGASQKSVIQRAAFERNYGIEEGTMSGIGSGLRSSLGGKEANQTVMKLQASLIASGITDAIGPYLETAASMLTELNEQGFAMDDSVLALFNSMSKTGMGEGRIKQLSMGADQGIRGATGESNAFFQDVFKGAKIGGGTIGGAQAAMRMGGLFGTDMGKYKGMSNVDKKTFGNLGIGGPNHMSQVAGSTLSRLDQMYGSESDIAKMQESKDPDKRKQADLQNLSRKRFIMNAFGLKDEGQASEVEGLLKQAKNTKGSKGQEAIRKKFQEIKEGTPELENLKAINVSNEGIYDLLRNKKISVEDKMGDATSALFNTMNDSLLSIDGMISTLLSSLGFDTADENKAQALSGDSMSNIELKSIANSKNPEQFKEELKAKRAQNQIELDKLTKEHMALPLFDRFFNKDNAKRARLGNANRNIDETLNNPILKGGTKEVSPLEVLNKTLKENTNQLKQIVNHTDTTARNSKERGTIKAASSSTTGGQ